MLPSPKAKPSSVRLFREEDIPAVAALHSSVFKLANRATPELVAEYRTYFQRAFFDNPWRDAAVGPLVYQEPGAGITGFMAVTPRHLRINGKPVQLAVMSQFVVDEASRGLAGMKLLSALFAGAQDITITDESSRAVRVMWEGLGGRTSLAHSMQWFYAVRPCRFGLMILDKTGSLPRALVRLAAPLARSVDTFSARFLKFPYRPVPPEVEGEELSAAALLPLISELGGKQWLRPDYDAESLEWILERAASLRSSGTFRKVLVKTRDGKLAGWYLYYRNPAGVSQVLQISATPLFTNQVLDHLLYDAWSGGATVLSGRLEMSRAFTQAFSDKHFIFHCGPAWVLFHSRRPELMEAFQRGEVYLSRLEGEWCTHFR
jgi:hypothetical protein